MAGTQVSPSLPSTGGGGSTAATFAGMFGDGTDGSYTVLAGATLTLGRERHYTDLTVQATGTVKPAGFKLCVSGTLTNAGSVNDNGPDASGTSGGGSLGARQYLNAASGGGVNGRSSTGVGNNGIASSANSYNNLGTLPTGGNGGAANAQAGGIGGACTVTNSRWASSLFTARAATTGFGGGGGGASGGVDATAGGADSGGTVSAAGGLGGAGINGGATGVAGTAGSVNYIIFA